MAVEFLPSQRDFTSSTAPPTYRSSPFHLLWSDIRLFFSYAYTLPGIVVPLGPWDSGALDELYPSLANIFNITVHVMLIVLQLTVLVSIAICVFTPVPLGVFILYLALFFSVNHVFCLMINGVKPCLVSRIDAGNGSPQQKHEDERWIFLNGVAVGQHWLQSNIDRLSITFGRRIVGFHNPTKGIILDILACLLQRDFSYSTWEVRNCYASVKAALTDEKLSKVVFILHSQGGIEGGLILDWLLSDVPHNLLAKLEVYTFGCAANHFNNPTIGITDNEKFLDSLTTRRYETNRRVIRHIEHYANSEDFVSRWGVLNFTRSTGSKDNRFVGRLFTREGSGHQLNQHYLDTMFPLVTPTGPVRDDGNFMNTLVSVEETRAVEREKNTIEAIEHLGSNSPAAYSGVKLLNGDKTPASTEYRRVTKLNAARFQKKPVSELSRLWTYRNGGSPPNDAS